VRASALDVADLPGYSLAVLDVGLAGAPSLFAR